MAKDRSRGKVKARKENIREERKVVGNRDLLTFSFKFLDQTQPKGKEETIALWEEKGLLKPLINRLKELSVLTREEALTQKQLKNYGDFPPNSKTDFFHPAHVEKNVAWGVIEGIGGLPRVAGFIQESTFYVVFLDSNHRFWISSFGQ
ncbi:hypothetical protein B4939_19160 [Vibrio cholerae]|uniref:hypothetical protein n=1 Tax=Vibrio cholerae TaxID=666 RepID=UPI001E62CE44|nr:hypothetical protein [Vibrio cholerae]MCD1209689.1 hypothetical protein [Vibrio cholerae]MCD1231428.1 hypothetical protein [Vibrio cholerae]HDZ9145655.1 hypothetical protein [Vibrio cholerae]HDZ9627207.1 hypothetical protein [Vibrio cholerae]